MKQYIALTTISSDHYYDSIDLDPSFVGKYNSFDLSVCETYYLTRQALKYL